MGLSLLLLANGKIQNLGAGMALGKESKILFHYTYITVLAGAGLSSQRHSSDATSCSIPQMLVFVDHIPTHFLAVW